MPRPSGRKPTPILTRRTFLKGSIAAGAAIAGGGVLTTVRPRRPPPAADTPIEHIVVPMQENRSFDHYYGYSPLAQEKGFGPPAGFSQPNPGGDPDPVEPYRFTELGTPDIPHDWDSVHGQWDGGKMDGFM